MFYKGIVLEYLHYRYSAANVICHKTEKSLLRDEQSGQTEILNMNAVIGFLLEGVWDSSSQSEMRKRPHKK